MQDVLTSKDGKTVLTGDILIDTAIRIALKGRKDSPGDLQAIQWIFEQLEGRAPDRPVLEEQDAEELAISEGVEPSKAEAALKILNDEDQPK